MLYSHTRIHSSVATWHANTVHATMQNIYGRNLNFQLLILSSYMRPSVAKKILELKYVSSIDLF